MSRKIPSRTTPSSTFQREGAQLHELSTGIAGAKTKAYALLFDVIGSSQHPDRAELTRKLQHVVERVNDEFRGDLLAPLEITRGDQLAAVLWRVSSLYHVLARVDELLHPVRFRSAVAYDALTAGLESGRAAVIDGPAFYTAHEKMQQLKRGKRTFALSGSVISGQTEINGSAEVLVNMLQWRWSQMTELQRKIVRLYEVEGNQLKVGELLGRSQQQVSHSLIATNWELIQHGTAAVHDLFQLIDTQNQVQVAPAGAIAAAG